MNDAQLQLFELYDIWYHPFWRERWFYITVSVIVLVIISALIYGLVRYIRYKRSKKIITPWQEALQALTILDSRHFSYNEQEQFYIQLTIILKRYLARRYGIFLESKTDEELLAAMNRIAFPKELIDLLSHIFAGAQVTKFAKQDVAQERMHHDLAHSVILIEKTMPTVFKET